MDYGILSLELAEFSVRIYLFLFLTLISLISKYTKFFRDKDIPNPVISRFFQINFESGVTSIQLTMNNIKESYSNPLNINNHLMVNSTVEAKASLIYNYEDGSRV